MIDWFIPISIVLRLEPVAPLYKPLTEEVGVAVESFQVLDEAGRIILF